MKCPNCNREIENDSVFCEYCGTKIKIVVNNSTDKPKVKWVQLILGIIGVVFGGYIISIVSDGGGIGIGLLLIEVVIVGIMVYLYKQKK